jgi:hypothetical protein
MVLRNFTHYFGFNVLQTWMYEPGTSQSAVRAINTAYFACFDLVPSILVTAAVILFSTHDLMFDEIPHYVH